MYTRTNSLIKTASLCLCLIFAVNALSQTDNSELNHLNGKWKIDLRQSPTSDPYFKEFEIKLVDNSSFTGKFYDSNILHGFINTSWSNIQFAFSTKDKSSSYYHSGYLEKDTIYGISYCPNRKFTMPWKGVKVEAVDQRHIKLDSIFNSLQEQNYFNGIALIGNKDSIEFVKAYGYDKFNPKQKVNLNTQFYLASLSKQFTAAAILLLAQKELLKPEQLVNTIIEDFPYPEVTIHNLLSHTSGVPGYIDPFSESWNKTKQANTDDVIEYLKTQKPKLNFSPGERFQYCNTNYVILAKIIENLSEMSYQSFMEKNIFNPFNLKHTYCTSKPYFNAMDINVAYGYLIENEHIIRAQYSKIEYMNRVNYLSGIQGDGSIVSSISDLFLWHKVLNSNDLLSEESKALMFNPAKLNNGDLTNYGYGWYLDNIVCEHTGYWPGYQTRIIRNRKTGAIGITLKNVERNHWTWISNFDSFIK